MNSDGGKVSNLDRCYPFCVIIVNTAVLQPQRVNHVEDKLSRDKGRVGYLFLSFEENMLHLWSETADCFRAADGMQHGVFLVNVLCCSRWLSFLTNSKSSKRLPTKTLF